MPPRSGRWGASLALLLLLGAGQAVAGALDALAIAYPNEIARIDGGWIVFRDGTRMAAGTDDPAKPFDSLLRDATIVDQFRLAYPRGAGIGAPAKDFDPGRFRNEAFFDKLYGNCRLARPDLVAVKWVDGTTVSFARLAAPELRAVADEIAELPPAIRRAAAPSAGTYNCRAVKDTGRRSMHAYGAAIDLNLHASDYWLWETGGWRNRMPRAIVDIFERHGFIWGGRWDHYDTMHFEYRPELNPAGSPADRDSRR
ncbi:MAG: M15 family metallopeptidase [Alphaproteobacteria bacterium]|nr:M15 family metallopeptidase [Alphaproteobacteria bacterium]